MKKSKSWVAIYKSFLKWEWYDDINVRILFLHILLKANYVDKEWHGKIIHRGEFITSLEHLSSEACLSIQQTRTAITKLKSTNEITYSGTPNYSRVKVNNYDKYQTYNKPINKRITNEQQTNNKRATTTIQDIQGIQDIHISKNIRKSLKKKKKVASYKGSGLEEVVAFYNETFRKNTKSTRGFEKNYEQWKDIHSLGKIKQAIVNASKDKFWKDKMTLTILFRVKNSNGEAVDYIEDLSSRVPKSGGSIGII